jgi:chromosome segregation ATPase
VLERINLVHQKAEGKQRDASELKEKIEEYRGDLEEISQEEDQVRTVDQIAELTLEKKVMSRALEILMRRLTDCEKEYNELAAERDDLINTLNETNEELNKTDPSFYRGPVFLDVAPREESESAEVSTTQNAKA